MGDERVGGLGGGCALVQLRLSSFSAWPATGVLRSCRMQSAQRSIHLCCRRRGLRRRAGRG